jgi:transcription termination/antitermination protein NusA
MLDLKNLRRAIEQLSEEKGVEPAKIIEAIEVSIAAAYKKEYEKKGEIIKTKLDPRKGELKFWQVKNVVDETTVRIVEETPEGEVVEDESVKKLKKEESKTDKEGDDETPLPRYNPDKHIFLEEAKKISAEGGLASNWKKDIKVGDDLEFPLETKEDFGRIAAQTAKQVILQKLREAERESVFKEYKDSEGDIVSGVIQRFERGNVYVDLGRTVGVMFHNESVPGEHYKTGDRMKFFVLIIQEESRMPGIILSRSHPKFISKLFSLEVPEIADGTVEIKSVAREPGSRSKIAVTSKLEGVDPVGACVGQRGTRVMAVSNEIGQEKIDIIEWSEDPAKFVGSSLSPAKIKDVEIEERREALVFVDDDQLSLAIGKGGQNVRLAAKLTGWKIDVRPESKPDEMQAEGVAEAEVLSEDARPEENTEENSQKDKKDKEKKAEESPPEADPPLAEKQEKK